MEHPPKVAERRVALTMSSQELEAIDNLVTRIARRTGRHIPRAELIRQSIKEMIERDLVEFPG